MSPRASRALRPRGPALEACLAVGTRDSGSRDSQGPTPAGWWAAQASTGAWGNRAT